MAEDPHFRAFRGLRLSSIGCGTRLGAPDGATDERYREAILEAIGRGSLVVDTSPSYRRGRSESVAGAVIEAVGRDRLVVCTKGGLIPADGLPPGHRIPYRQVVGRHCIAPGFIKALLGESRKRLGVDVIDVFCLEDVELQLQEVSDDELTHRLVRAFEVLEDARSGGLLRHYGISSSDGLLRSRPARTHLSLERVVQAARSLGEANGFGFVIAPFSVTRPNALTDRNQMVDGESFSLLQACENLGLAFFAAESLQGGRTPLAIPRWLSGLLGGAATPAQQAIQFVRSAPGVTTALVGMSRKEHAIENLDLAAIPPLGPEEFQKLNPEGAAQIPWLF